MAPERIAQLAGAIGVAALSALLLFTGATLEHGERDLFSITFDARVFYVVAGVLGFAALIERRLLPWWALAMTAPTLGRAITLAVDGSPVVSSRVAEWRGAFVWLVLWLFGALCVLVLEGTATLRRYRDGR